MVAESTRGSRCAPTASTGRGSRDPDAWWRAACRLGAVATLAARGQPTFHTGGTWWFRVIEDSPGVAGPRVAGARWSFRPSAPDGLDERSAEGRVSVVLNRRQNVHWARDTSERAAGAGVMLPQKAARCGGAGAAGFPRQRMSARHRAPGPNCVPLLAFAQGRGAPPARSIEPKRVGERRANWRCPERSEPTCFEVRCRSPAADCLGRLTGAPALCGGGTEGGSVVSGVGVVAFAFGRISRLHGWSPGFRVQK